MKWGLVVFATLCLALVAAIHQEVHTADKTFLTKQKAIYELLWHVDQPTTVHPELYQVARSFNLEEHVAAYPGHEHVVHDFVQRLKYGLLPRDIVISVFHPEHRDEIQALFKLFYHAKDFDTFHNVAIWARFNVNPSVYIYTLFVAVLHRPDTKHIHLPPVYTILPHFFYNNEVLQAAYRAKLGDASIKKSVDAKYHEGADLIIHANYSGWYIVHDDADEKLSYFTEDVGLNNFYFYQAHEFPYWMDSENYTLTTSIRGEVYYFGHKQLLARYYMERLSNDMDEIETIDFHQPIVTGYYPSIHHPNGLPFTHRPSHSHVAHHMYDHVNHIEQLAGRIHSTIDTGFVLDSSRPPKQVDIYTTEGINILGNIIEGNSDSVNHQFYGSIDHLARYILGSTVKSFDKNHYVPSALDYFVTSLRDPAFYRIYKKIVSYFHHFKSHAPKFTHEDLVFSGVKIDSVAVDKLVTYFDHFDSEISTGVPVTSMKDAETTIIKVRQQRLNHKPFTYHIGITSDKNVKATVRIFLGPKYDVHGHEIDFVHNWANFVELDQFIVDLKTGTNKIQRHSHESIYVVPDEMQGDVYYKKVVNALANGEALQYNEQPYGFPDRLVLPKGKKEGLPLKLFVYVSEFHEDQAVTVKSPIWGTTVSDGKPLGYPLDRPVAHHVFVGVPNAYFKDVVVFHKQVEELNQTI